MECRTIIPVLRFAEWHLFITADPTLDPPYLKAQWGLAHSARSHEFTQQYKADHNMYIYLYLLATDFL